MTARVPRDYQLRGERQTREQWQAGHQAVCLVSPCGSGKTDLGAMLCNGFRRVVWVAHRKELISQAIDRLHGDFGYRVGAICPDMPADPGAPIQVGTIQSLLARNIRPEADLVVYDEGHHHLPASAHWSTFAPAYEQSKRVFLTATPERADGSPMGDVCSALVVVASYSELLAAGHLAPFVVYAPPPDKAKSGWSMDPVSAYTTLASGSLALAFFDRVARAGDWERSSNLAGVAARSINGKTPAKEREAILQQFAAGRIRLLANVGVLTEGTDLPAASTCILARSFQHASSYIQAVCRVGRVHPGKSNALLLDLVDATSKHGYPTEDREYSLTGKAIMRQSASSVRRCAECMAMYPNGLKACPLCGWVPPVPPTPTVRIYDAGLERVYCGADTADEHKLAEYRRLRVLARSKGLGLSFVVREYEKLFGVKPLLAGVPESERRAEYDRLRVVASAKGYKHGWVAHRYHALFLRHPPFAWSQAPLARSLPP